MIQSPEQFSPDTTKVGHVPWKTSTTDISIVQVGLEDVIPLRHALLRPGQPRAAAYLPQDNWLDAIHLAARSGNEIVAVASLYPEVEPEHPYDQSWRLRGMATAPSHRGQGLSGRLLLHCLNDLVDRGAGYVWCHARLSAEGFYRRFGFVSYGEPFTLPDLGPHIKMGCLLYR